MKRPPVMDKLVAAAREALAAGRTTVRIRVPADRINELPFGRPVEVDGETASVEFDAELLLRVAGRHCVH